MIEAPGLYTMTADTYHADPCPAPSLSSSIARELLTCSAHHAWFAHPRLNPSAETEHSERFDLGTAAHAYLIEGKSDVAVIDASDWRTKAAQTARDAARADGKVPLLAAQWAGVQAMAEAARRQLEAHEDRPLPLADGMPEQTLIWREGEVWCRARLDWLHDDRRMVDDYKTTSGSANPDAWTRRTLFDTGYDVQAAFYLRGLRAVLGVEAAFRFVVQETFAPYALSVIGLSPAVLALAEKKVRHAIEVWSWCLAANRWPGYPTRTCYAELPGWEETRWLERELRDDGRPVAEQLIGSRG